jgi:uncharacterized protein YdeI (YjbR/CyaY-like superfamily)
MERFTDVDAYLERSDRWRDVVVSLRAVLLGCPLDEQIKWGKPCYTNDGANIAIIQEMKEFVALMFFKGTLLDDPDGHLEDQGPNSRSARRMRFACVDDVTRSAATIERFVDAAIDVERSGLDVGPAPALELVEELRVRLDADPALRAAFESLTPGRQREYHLYVAEAKRSATRASRVDGCVDRILQGKGRRDR